MGALIDRLGSASKEGNKLRNINISTISTNSKNHYPISEINELSETIKEVGLLQPLTVIKQNDGYLLVDGERRFTALKMLVDFGYDEYEEVPCFVKNDFQDETQEHLALIVANTQKRVRTPDVILKEVEILNGIYDTLVNRNEKPDGKRRDWIASMLGMSPRQIQEYITALKNDELSESIEAGETVSKAKEKKSKKEMTAKQALNAILKSIEKGLDVINDAQMPMILNEIIKVQGVIQTEIDRME